MSYKSCCVDNVYVLRWERPVVSDLPVAMGEIEVAVRGGAGMLAAVISVVPKDMPTPDAVFRQAASAAMENMARMTDSVIVVIEGRGPQFTVMRAAAAAMATLTRSANRASATASMEDALKRVSRLLPAPVPEVLEHIRAQMN